MHVQGYSINIFFIKKATSWNQVSLDKWYPNFANQQLPGIKIAGIFKSL